MSKPQPITVALHHALPQRDWRAFLEKAFHHATSADDRDTALFLASLLALTDPAAADDLVSFWWNDDVT